MADKVFHVEGVRGNLSGYQGPRRVYGRGVAMPVTTRGLTDNVTDGALLSFGSARQKEHTVIPIWQGNEPGNQNACGTTALAMALNALQNATPTATETGKHSFTRQELDARRPFDSYTAPGTLVKLAREKGFHACLFNRANFDAIKRQIDAGHLVIVLENPAPRHWLSPLHYVVVHGYKDSSIPSERTLIMTDPAYRSPEKARYEMAYQDFLPHWNNVKIANVPTGISRFMVVVGGKGSTLPPAPFYKVPLAVHMANAWQDGINWYAKSFVRRVGNWILRGLKGFKNLLNYFLESWAATLLSKGIYGK